MLGLEGGQRFQVVRVKVNRSANWRNRACGLLSRPALLSALFPGQRPPQAGRWLDDQARLGVQHLAVHGHVGVHRPVFRPGIMPH
jgi:hypothetical protein